MLKYWPLRSHIDIWRIKLKSPNHVRYRLSVGLWGVEVMSASRRPVWTSGAKNITVYFKLTRSWGGCWSPCTILLLINKINIVSDIGWSSAISAWNCHLIHDNDIGLISTAAMKLQHWSLFCQKVCQKMFGRIFQVRFATKYIFQWGPVFIEPVRTHKYSLYLIPLVILSYS